MKAFGWILTLGALGGAAYLYKKKDDGAPEGMHRMPDGTLMPDTEMPGAYQPGGAEPWGQIPDEILKKYQSIIYGHGTAQDCTDVLSYIDRLEPETQAETDWLGNVRSQVTAACEQGAVPVASNPPALPDWIPDWSQNGFDFCWNAITTGSPCDVQAVVDTITPIIERYRGFVAPEQTRQAYSALAALQDRYGVAGVREKIAHVGDCGCASCEAKRVGHDEEPCCAECAAKGVGSCACQQVQDERLQYTGAT